MKMIDERINQKYPTDIEYDEKCKSYYYGLPKSYKYYLRLQNTDHKKYTNMARTVAILPVDIALYSTIIAFESVLFVGHFASNIVM